MDARVKPSRGLTQHVRAFEGAKCRLYIAQLVCSPSGIELGFDSWTDLVMETRHGLLVGGALENGRVVRGEADRWRVRRFF